MAECSGVHQLSLTEPTVRCAEFSTLTDEVGNLIPGYTRAEAHLRTGLLAVATAGGQIRDVGFNGGEATAMLKERLHLHGTWEGSLPVTVSIWLDYQFGGERGSRLDAMLSTTSRGNWHGDNRAQIRLEFYELSGTSLFDLDSTGNFEIPAEGRYEGRSLLRVAVTELVTRARPIIDIRTFLKGYALPYLGRLGSVVSAFASATARISIAAPCQIVVTSSTGLFLADSDRNDVRI